MPLSTAHTSEEPTYAVLQLPGDVGAPALARNAVQDLLGTLPPPLLARLSLVASELVTNVLRHSSADDHAATLTLAVAADRITLSVADSGDGFDPSEHLPSNGQPGGWGLKVVEAIADRWWVERGSGTRVICEIDR